MLPLVLVLLLGLSLLGHALWTLADLEQRMARAERDHVEAGYAARVRLARAASTDGPDLPSEPPPGVQRTPLSESLILLTAGPVADPWATLVLDPTPATLLQEIGALLVDGGAHDPISISRTRATADPSCGAPVLATRHLGAPALPTFAGLRIDAPRVGVPSLPAALIVPADSLAPVTGRTDGSVLLDGEGRAAVVAGRIEVAPGARIHGVLIALGEVVVGPQAVVRGAVVAGAGLRVEDGGSVELSACAALDALGGSVFEHPRRVGPRAWPLR